MQYKLTQSDIDVCRDYADRINRLKDNWSSNKKLTDNPHYIGKLGEVAFGGIFNIPVNFDVHYQGDLGIDFKIGDFTIDIKATQYYRFPELKEFVDSKNNPDIYVLSSVNLNNNTVSLIGFISAKKLKKNTPILYRGLGLRYVATTDQLCKDWDLLFTYCDATKKYNHVLA